MLTVHSGNHHKLSYHNNVIIGDKNAAPLVRYSPKGTRKSILRPKVFSRFGQQERSALATFDFLQEHPTDVSSCASTSPESENKAKEAPSAGGSVRLRRKKMKDKTKRLSRSLTDLEKVTKRERSKSSGSLKSDEDSGGSSLLLSDLCAAADQSLSSSSSLSFQCS